MRSLPLLASRLFDTPLLAHPGKARQVARAFLTARGDRMAFQPDETPGGLLERRGKSYAVVQGIAIIPVEGSLAHKTGNLDAYSGVMGYDGITTKLREASADHQVKAIWFDISSGGGEVEGAFALADEIWRLNARNGGKPIWAMANEHAYSAAYLLAAQADVVVAPKVGGVGSIGVISMHVDATAALEQDGLKVTVIRAGERKAKGNPYEALDAETEAEWQGEADRIRGIFADYVARGRRISRDAVLATEAAVFNGEQALKIGLTDAMASEVDAFAALLSETRRAA